MCIPICVYDYVYKEMCILTTLYIILIICIKSSTIFIYLHKITFEGVETGLLTQLPATWEKGMTRLGMDYMAMQRAYMEWRSRKAEAILEGMKHGD